MKMMYIFTVLKLRFRRGGEIGETDDDTQSGSATDIIGTSEVNPTKFHMLVFILLQYILI